MRKQPFPPPSIRFIYTKTLGFGYPVNRIILIYAGDYSLNARKTPILASKYVKKLTILAEKKGGPKTSFKYFQILKD